jgi:hypothetical protein
MQDPKLNLYKAYREFLVHAKFFYKKNMARVQKGKLTQAEASEQERVRNGIAVDLLNIISKGSVKENELRKQGLVLVKSDLQSIVATGPELVRKGGVTQANLLRRISALQLIVTTIQQTVYTGSHRPISATVQTSLFSQPALN